MTAEEQKLLACIHCGLCLEACPTYVLTGDENDGPRGRLYLMRAVGEGRLASDSAAFERHIDRCLGCRACESVCPAGVEYGQLLEAARSELFQAAQKRGLNYRLLRLALRHLWSARWRQRLVLSILRIVRDSGAVRLLLRSRIPRFLSTRFEFALALLESSKPRSLSAPGGGDIPASRKSEQSVPGPGVMLFTGCVGEGLFKQVNDATVRVLRINSHTVDLPTHQVCCGALHAHAGDLEGARRLARQNIKAFEAAVEAPIVTNAGGCGALLASYHHLLAGDGQFVERAVRFSSRVRDVSQLLEEVPIKVGVSFSDEAVTYDASCHLHYGQHAGEAPLRMLQAIPDLKFSTLQDSQRCCGGAGIYNLLEPELSRQVLEQKLARVQATRAGILTTGNAGCHMQIGAGAYLAGLAIGICHPVELLDESYRRAGLYQQ
ncbi:MAG TPA: heterodisulfide reductase-related iron-sulfur binding cluster [Pyrinomonadaceae bacterium]|nr:heterodisulfide reductase-related iron-sulfur binding cluster [Pyrinomonadaceae bacterium]